jgi:hypothetical protein
VLRATIALLFSLSIAGSSNSYGGIGFWQVLNAKANPLQLYWQFPHYFLARINKLPKNILGLLARHQIPTAQYEYSLHLLKAKQIKAAKLFWRASLPNISNAQIANLSQQLLATEQWGDLKLLNALGYLKPGFVLNHFNLHHGVIHTQIPKPFLHSLEFLSLDSNILANKKCQFNVLTMSDHRSGLYKLSALIKTYNKKPEPRQGAFCFSKPVYVAGALKCSNSMSKAANCDWQSALINQQLLRKFDFVVMMSRYGSANVSRGVMQLNSGANYGIFLHELMHFNGFEDEYILPKSKQAWLCKRRGLVAPNLYIAQKGEKSPNGWHKSKSCQIGGVAYKPSKDWSILEYQQITLSDQYRALWLAHIDKIKR